MEVNKHWGNMIIFSCICEKPGFRVLESLEFLDLFLREAIQKSITIVMWL